MDNRPSKKCSKSRNERKLIKYRCDSSSILLRVLQARGWTRIFDTKDPKWDLWWCDTSELKSALDSSMKLKPQQKVPHFLNHSELTRKNYLYRNLKRYKKLLLKADKAREAEFCNAMPISFELPNEYRMLVEEHRKRPGTTWIVKPAGGSQGRGIFLFQRLKDIAEWRLKEFGVPSDSFETNPITYQETYVVQKYIDDPYLLGGRKFDLRIYVLVTSFQPLKVWLAREGFARLSGERFSLERIKDSRVHLTNMSIQLRTKKELTNADSSFKDLLKNQGDTDECTFDLAPVRLGRKWALSGLRQYLTMCHGVPAVDELLQNIAGVIMASLQAVQSVIIPSKNSFELYGYDIILDKNLKPWLLEVNASPSLTATDAEDSRLKFDLIDDVLNILDFERLLTGREIRVGGFDLLWDDAPVWTGCTCEQKECPAVPRRLNIFLGAENDRIEQLQALRKRLAEDRS